VPPPSVKVEIPAKLLNLSREFETRSPKLYAQAAQGMAVEVARLAPGGPGKKIGLSFHAVGPLVVSASRAAHALDVGAYITARPRSSGRPGVLRFQGSDGPVYRAAVRLPARHYVRRALRHRRSVINAAVRVVYRDLLA